MYDVQKAIDREDVYALSEYGEQARDRDFIRSLIGDVTAFAAVNWEGLLVLIPDYYDGFSSEPEYFGIEVDPQDLEYDDDVFEWVAENVALDGLGTTNIEDVIDTVICYADDVVFRSHWNY